MKTSLNYQLPTTQLPVLCACEYAENAWRDSLRLRRRAGGVFGILPCTACYAKCRFRACGAVLLLNVANVVMLPFANAANCQFITPPSLGTEN